MRFSDLLWPSGSAPRPKKGKGRREREPAMEKTRREEAVVSAGAEMEGWLMLEILITPSASDPARSSRRGLGVKTKAPPAQMASAPLPPRLQLCPLRWQALGMGLAE